MIRSFRDKVLERFFGTGDGRRLSVQNTRRIANILRALDDASHPEDMNLPGFRFHALVGRDKGRYAVNASGNWRIIRMEGWRRHRRRSGRPITEDRLDDQEALEAA